MAVSDYKTDPNENTTISGINIAEGCPPSGINNAIRQLMADVKTATEGCLPLTGGTMTGSIVSSGVTALKKNNNTTSLRFSGGSDNGLGGELLLYGKDHADDAGEFILRATRGDNVFKSLRGMPNGTLSWDGKNVECVNAIGSNYIRYEKGLQICWGFVSVTTSDITVTLPASFKNANEYLVQIQSTHGPDAITGVNTWNIAIGSITKTTFKVRSNISNYATWVAIGFWK